MCCRIWLGPQTGTLEGACGPTVDRYKFKAPAFSAIAIRKMLNRRRLGTKNNTAGMLRHDTLLKGNFYFIFCNTEAH